MVAISVIILILCALLALVVLAQNPKGGGLAAGFTGAQQIGGVQRTADFLEKGTWTFAGLLMALCLVSAGLQHEEKQDMNGVDPSTVQAADDGSADGATDNGGATEDETPADPGSVPAQ